MHSTVLVPLGGCCITNQKLDQTEDKRLVLVVSQLHWV